MVMFGHILFCSLPTCQVALRDIHLSLNADPPQHTKSHLLLRKLRCLIKENAQDGDIMACMYRSCMQPHLLPYSVAVQ